MNSIATFGLTAMVLFGLAAGLAVNARAAEPLNPFEGRRDFVGMAVQGPTLSDDVLGVDAVFWSVEAPRLTE